MLLTTISSCPTTASTCRLICVIADPENNDRPALAPGSPRRDASPMPLTGTKVSPTSTRLMPADSTMCCSSRVDDALGKVQGMAKQALVTNEKRSRDGEREGQRNHEDRALALVRLHPMVPFIFSTARRTMSQPTPRPAVELGLPLCGKAGSEDQLFDRGVGERRSSRINFRSMPRARRLARSRPPPSSWISTTI